MTRLEKTTRSSLATLFLAALPVLAGEVITEDEGKTFVANSPVIICANVGDDDECDPDQCEDVTASKTGGLPGASRTRSSNACEIVVSQAFTRGPVLVDPLTQSSRHTAFDYRSGGTDGATPQGCGSCGASDAAAIGSAGSLYNLSIARIFRSRDVTWYGSFGPSVFSGFDKRLKFYRRGYHANEIHYFDPIENYTKRLRDGMDGDTFDGVYHSVASGHIKELRLLDNSSNTVSDIAAAVSALITDEQGVKYTFDLIDMNAGSVELMGYWKLDEGSGSTIADSSGNGFSGTLYGATWTTGVSSNALDFDGVNDYVSLGNPSNLNFTGNFTISAWVKLDSTTGMRTILAHGYGTDGETVLRISDGYFVIGAWTPAYSSGASTPVRAGDVGNWVHICGVYDNGQWRLYRNGVLMASALGVQGAVRVSANWAIGARGTGTERFLDGKIDEVRLYKGALNGEQITALAGKTASGATLKAQWMYDEGSGTTVGDSSGNGHNGTVYNGGVWITGKSGTALNYDGANDYAGFGNPTGMNFNGAITLSGWIRPSRKTGCNSVICHGDGNNFVFFRIYNGNYEVGVRTPTLVKYAQCAVPDSDIGAWVHLAGCYKDGAWKFYRNGVLSAATLSTVGSVSTPGNWTVASFLGTWYMDGSTDEMRVYQGARADWEIAEEAESPSGPEPVGRLTRIEDRNGYALTLDYKSWTTAELEESPERQWQLDSVTDAYGRTASFTYSTNQVSGRWAVSRIDLPNGEHVDYEYADGKLASVLHADGSESTYTWGSDATAQTSTLVIDEAAGGGDNRRVKLYLTDNATLTGSSGNQSPLINQASLLTRMAVNGAGEVFFLGAYESWDYQRVYAGAGRLKRIYIGLSQVRHYKDGWTFGNPSQGLGAISGTLENTYPDQFLPSVPAADRAKGRIPKIQDATGRQYTYLYDSQDYVSQKTYPGGATEQWQYNSFHQVTRYKDRLNRVTKYAYDSRGNLLTRQEGIKYVGTLDVSQAEFAEYRFEYYPAGHTNQYRLRYEFDAVPTVGGTTDRRKEYLYSTNQFLTEIREPDDTGSGYHTAQSFTYDSAGRLKTSTDAAGRTATYFYDPRDRVVEIRYADESTERFDYGDSGSGAENLVVHKQDRNGNVAALQYDLAGRVTNTIHSAYRVSPYKSSGDTNVVFLETLLVSGTEITDPSIRVEECTAYLPGTRLESARTDRGETISHAYDYRQRRIETVARPRAGLALTNTVAYIDNLLFSTQDPYGRKTFRAYRTNDTEMVRQVTAARPNPPSEPTTFAAVAALSRAGTPGSPATNETYLVTDFKKDAHGQTYAVIDPRGVVNATEFDSRRRVVKQVEAAADAAGYSDANFTPTINLGALAAIAARTETDYDVENNVTEIRLPRYFDSSDTNAYNKAKVTQTYTRRNLLAARTEAAGDSAYPAGTKVTESFAYGLDRRLTGRIDFRSNLWSTVWQQCCAREAFRLDPVGSLSGTNARPASFSNYDHQGNITHTAQIRDATGLTCCGPLDLPDADTLAESTTRYDARNRPSAQTVWLVPLGTVDPNAVPIAGGPDPSDPPVEISGVKQGLTTRWLYDENLTDGVGLDSAAGVAVDKLDSSGSFAVSISQLLAELASDGVSFGAGSDGSAVVVLNPEEEPSVSIMDGLGRAVASGMLQSWKSGSTNAPITWNTVKHDAVVTVSGFGSALETAQRDALDHVKKTRADAVNRTLEIEDAAGYVTVCGNDANGNRIRLRDPNGVGEDAVYDNRNRLTIRTDTQGDATQSVFDKAGLIVRTIDALTNSTYFAYDPRNRQIRQTDRLGGVIAMAYDQNNNMTTLIDQDGSSTTNHYDPRNLLRAKVLPPGEYADADTNSDGYPDARTLVYSYDGARRLTSRLDQSLQLTEYAYDMASRLLAVEYFDGLGDDYEYDDASRQIISDSTRYTNSVVKVYDDAGRQTGETTTVNGESQTVSYGYDAAGRQTNVVYPGGDTVARTYNSRDQLIGVSRNGQPVASYTIDAGGRKTELVYANGVTNTWTYDNANQILSVSAKYPSSTSYLSHISYTVDANKRRTAGADGVATNLSNLYGYDNEDRLVEWDRQDGRFADWNLTLGGDWQTLDRDGQVENRTHTPVHELIRISNGYTNALAYDPRGNMVIDQVARVYAWDPENRLSAVEPATPTNGSLRLDFAYDSQSRRVSKKVSAWNGSQWTNLSLRTFTYDGWNLIAEKIDATPSSRTNYFVWGTDLSGSLQGAGGIGGLLCSGSSVSAAVNYFHYDGNGNILALSDTNGTVAARYVYDPYGTLTDVSGPAAADNPFRFSTKYHDAEVDLYYYGYRYYSPGMGRWISRDPLLEGAASKRLTVPPRRSIDSKHRSHAEVEVTQFLILARAQLVAGGAIQIPCGNPQVIKQIDEMIELQRYTSRRLSPRGSPGLLQWDPDAGVRSSQELEKGRAEYTFVSNMPVHRWDFLGLDGEVQWGCGRPPDCYEKNSPCVHGLNGKCFSRGTPDFDPCGTHWTWICVCIY